VIGDTAVGPADAEARRATSALSPAAQVWTIIAAMTAMIAGCFALMPERMVALQPSPWWVVIPIVIAHAAAERSSFDIAIGDEGHAFSLSELPTALSIVFLSPSLAVAARLVGVVPVLFGPRRNRGIKLVFNALLVASETIVAMLVSRLLLEWWGESNSLLLVAVMVGLLAGSLVAGCGIAVVVSRFEGGLVDRLKAEVVDSWWFYATTVVFATMAVAVALWEPWLVVIVLVPALGLWAVLRSYGHLNQELRDLDALHGFAGRVGSSLEVEAIESRAVADAVELIRADGAALLRFDGETIVRHVAGHMPVRLPREPDDPFWNLLVADRHPRMVGVNQLRRYDVVTDARLRTLMVAPIIDEDEVFAVLVVSERNVQRYRFTGAELARLRNIADQLAVGLRRGLLHERLEYEARHDALTGLPARRLFEERASEAIGLDDGRVRAIMMLDLDRFKEVNDTLGHHAGDELLVEFSSRMSALLGPGDMLARLAGDEFAILCERDDRNGAVAFARACVAAGSKPVVLDGLEIVVTVSVGVAMFDAAETDPLQPMRRADIAMYNAKWQRTGVEVYRDEIDRRTPARLSMLGDLRAAIEHEDLTVVYQPKLELATRAVVGVEALVRWSSPVRGVVAPSEFVRVAEDTGLIKDLTDYVLNRGFADLRTFQDAGLDLRMAVNLSTHDLFDTKLPHRVEAELRRNRIDPADITLEITESSLLVDAPRTRATIDDLHRAGFRLAVDDFGTGYSSLSYLRRLPVQELKIDHSFVHRMLVDPQDEVIVRSTIELGHNLDLSVVAEGVEDPETLRALTLMGCDIAQGFGIAYPLDALQLIEWVRAAPGSVVSAPR